MPIFIIFLKFSQQLYEVDTIISPGFTEENTESLRDKAVRLVMQLIGWERGLEQSHRIPEPARQVIDDNNVP